MPQQNKQKTSIPSVSHALMAAIHVQIKSFVIPAFLTCMAFLNTYHLISNHV